MQSEDWCSSGSLVLCPFGLCGCICRVHPAWVGLAEQRALNCQKKAFPGFFIRLMWSAWDEVTSLWHHPAAGSWDFRRWILTQSVAVLLWFSSLSCLDFKVGSRTLLPEPAIAEIGVILDNISRMLLSCLLPGVCALHFMASTFLPLPLNCILNNLYMSLGCCMNWLVIFSTDVNNILINAKHGLEIPYFSCSWIFLCLQAKDLF